jgi:hypothetical protein
MVSLGIETFLPQRTQRSAEERPDYKYSVSREAAKKSETGCCLYLKPKVFFLFALREK